MRDVVGTASSCRLSSDSIIGDLECIIGALDMQERIETLAKVHRVIVQSGYKRVNEGMFRFRILGFGTGRLMVDLIDVE